jgi:hypothetical protein
MRGSSQTIALQPFDIDSGNLITCMCEVRNDDGFQSVMSSHPVTVHRDKDYMYVNCENDEYKGNATVDGKVDVGFVVVDFLIDYCTISGLIDGYSGAWSSYPNVVRIPMKAKVIEEPKVIVEPEETVEEPRRTKRQYGI